MNFYKRYMGDIQAKTGNLSLAEFGAYDRLLDHYYSTEQAIPADDGECYRICRAMSKEERKAVDKVVSRFFELTDKGYVQSKAEEQIAKALPLIEAARANGKKGGRPKKPITQPEPSGFQKQNPDGTQDESYPKPKPDELPNLPTVSVDSPAGDHAKPTRIPCPYNALLAVFHEECPSMPRVMKLSANRRTVLAARWKEVDEDSGFESVEDGLGIFRAIFKRAHDSDFLSGRSGKFKPGFDWLVKSENFLKLCEGNYDNDRSKK